MALFVALAMIFSYLEFLLPLPVPFPGIKLGLANLAIVVPLYLWGLFPALAISLLRIALVGITFGSLATILYSLFGALLSLAVMAGLKKWNVFSVTGVSMAGGVCHNIGQLAAAALIVENIRLFYYLPVLLAAGALTGFAIGAVSAQVLKRLPTL
ncbi:heptaprenyl diphosphate synthase [Lachnospiraceae bacterium oral taxon 500]|nr:heptaprenyl diphosphate synthase [Lachnospiraceae bacterium oral taxon 500]